MFNRPRCRDWTPLATQQLRLRNLIQITGHNITTNVAANQKASIYFTLHLTTMSAPFFTSERIETPANAIWSEINCQSILKSTSRCVCIRLWQHILTSDKVDNDMDKVLFLWGVYFSGLTPITKRSDVKLRPNSLVFYMHGGFFTSTVCLEAESIRPQAIAIGSICDKIGNVGTIVVSSDSNSSTSEDESLLKVRFTEKEFFKSELRRSYAVDKLLVLQEKQRKSKYKNESAKELTEKICMRSAFCLNLDLIANKSMLYRPRVNPSMGRTLNRLLFQQHEQPKPEVILKAQDLRRQIETAQFRCRLLLQERDRSRFAVRQLEVKLGQLTDVNIETESWMMAAYRALSKDKETEAQRKLTYASQRQAYHEVLTTLEQRRLQLLRELKEIYSIRQNSKGVFAINDVILPDAESYADAVSPTALSVALGYAAHTVLMCSIILNVPLRNPIIHKGSASKIIDNVKNLPAPDREFPLFGRSSPPPDALLYAVFLLNQNIAQFKFQLGMSKGDLRATLPNLLHLLNGPPPEVFGQIFPDAATVSGSSQELNVAIPIAKHANGEPNGSARVCRSVGSYPDDKDLGAKGQFTSEPILSIGQNQLMRFTENATF